MMSSIAPRDSASEWKMYYYVPNLGINIEFIVLFSLVSLVQATIIYRPYMILRGVDKARGKKLSLLAIPFLIGAICETVGYVGRVLSHSDNTALGSYIMQSICILVAPSLMAGSIYMAFHEIIKSTDSQKHCIIPGKYISPLFVTGDVLSIILQGAGGGIMSGAGTYTLGERLIIAGLFVQLLFFGLFVAVTLLFCYRRWSQTDAVKTAERSKLFNRGNGFGFTDSMREIKMSWRVQVVCLVLISCFILIRSIYRVIEYIEGYSGYLQATEIYLFVLDASMIFFGCCIWLWQNVATSLARYELRKAGL